MSKCGTTEFVSWFFSSEIVGLSPTLCLGFSVLVFCILAAATVDHKDLVAAVERRPKALQAATLEDVPWVEGGGSRVPPVRKGKNKVLFLPEMESMWNLTPVRKSGLAGCTSPGMDKCA